MAKYYRRQGTTPYRFVIDAEIEKVELKLPSSGPHPQRISVIFKRGDVRKETKNAPLVEGGIAYFDERLAVPATLYYDERRKAFLEKEATLAVNLFSKRTTKLMGVTKFDLAPFVNNNIKEQSIVLKMDKCADKNAKFYFRLTLTEVQELGGNMNKMGSFGGRIEEGENGEGEGDEEEEEYEQNQERNEKGEDIYSYYSNTNSPRQEKVKGIEENEDLIGSPVNFQFTSNNESELSILAKAQSAKKFDWRVSDQKGDLCNFESVEDESPQRLGSSLLRRFEKAEEENQKRRDAKELDEKVETIEKELTNLSNSLRLSNQGFLSVYNRKLGFLKFVQLKEEYERLQRAYRTLEQKYQSVVDGNGQSSNETKEGNSDINFHQSKILDLERKNKELETQNDVLAKKSEEVEKLNAEYLTRIEGYIEQENKLTNIELFNTTQFDKAIEDIIFKFNEEGVDRRNLKNCEALMKELLQKLSDSKNTMSRRDELQKLEKERSQKLVQSLEQRIQQLLKENEQYKNGQKPEEGRAVSPYSLKIKEESTMEESDFSQTLDRSGFESVKTGMHGDVAALKQEINQLNAKLQATVNLQKRYEEQIKKKQQIEQEMLSMKKELEKAKKGWAYAEDERYELALKLKEFQEGGKSNKKVEALEMEVFKLKTRLGEVMNITLELGKPDLLDRIESIIGASEVSDIRASISKQSFWD